MPDEVRAELSPWFIEKQAIMEDTPEKMKKLDDTAKHGTSSLKVNYLKVDSEFMTRTHVLICMKL